VGSAELLHPSRAPVRRVSVAAYRIPTDEPESDGTFAWSATTLVVVHVECGGVTGFGYTYAPRATALLIQEELAPTLQDRDAFEGSARWHAMAAALRNAGRPGIGAMAIAAVDTALWDARAKLLGTPLVTLLGAARDAIAVYGSGGFTSYSLERLEQQLGGWAAAGMRFVKMKVGRAPEQDPVRVRTARRAIGERAELFVDANGAYSRKQALACAEAFAVHNVTWLEEPVSADDLEGLCFLRQEVSMDVAAGEYGYDLPYFRRLLQAGAVDVLQADATRCGGVTGFMEAAALCSAFGVRLSSHCAPSLHLPLMCAARAGVHLEYFHDHARIEEMLFDGAARPKEGFLRSDLQRPGLGIELKTRDAERFRV
jgi:L-alanine-DL-glutamate epimerase-like enolase superfamily enzyme